MAGRRGSLSRRELLELAAAAGALSLLPGEAIASESGAAPACQSADDTADAELIGKVLWSAFKKGAGLRNEISPGLEKRGREMSGPPICDNLKRYGLTDFPLNKTVKCAFNAGKEARKNAHDGGHEDISVADFEKAWNTISEQMHEAAARLQGWYGKEVILGGGC